MRPITISLSPNTKGEDVLKAIQIFLAPWRYKDGKAISMLEQWFRNYFKVSYAISFNSGRSALVAILKQIINPSDEVLIQSFTCVVVPDAVLLAGGVPRYVDINDTLTMNVNDLKKKVTSKTKVIIVQHTFGIPSQMEKIIKIAREHKLLVIEDCAHLLGPSYNGKKLGTFGDVAFFSFGRDKAFSSVFGGMVITSNQELGKKIRKFQKTRQMPSVVWVGQQLLHPILFSIILPVYSFMSIGKIMLFILQKLNLLSFPVSASEKNGEMSSSFVQRMPNALCELALLQLKKIKEFNIHRQIIVNYYLKSIDISFKKVMVQSFPFLRFPVLHERAKEIVAHARKKEIYLGDWYANCIDPKGSNFQKVNYKKDSCPNAQYAADHILNLPTYPAMSLNDARKIVTVINAYVNSRRS